MAAHTKIDLYQMQSLPLDEKIRMTARSIDAFIDRNDAYLSISVEYQLRTGSVVMLPAYLHVEAIIKQRGGRNIEIKQENGVVNV